MANIYTWVLLQWRSFHSWVTGTMNIREEFRKAFRQYCRRYGLPLACPSNDVRAGDLCVFNIDGTVVSLGSVLDSDMDEKHVTRTVDKDVDPIISNGMRCRTLPQDERKKCSLSRSWLK